MRKTRHSWPHSSNFTNHIVAISDAHIFLTLPEFITEFCIKLFFFKIIKRQYLSLYKLKTEIATCKLLKWKQPFMLMTHAFATITRENWREQCTKRRNQKLKKKKSSFVFVVFVTFAVEIWNLFFLGTHFKALASPCLFCGLCHIAR